MNMRHNSIRRIFLAVTIVVMTATTAVAQGYGIAFGDLEVTNANASDIFGDGKAHYDPTLNLLSLEDGFEYHLSKNFVTINTGRELGIRLVGDAMIVASVDCGDDLYIETVGGHTLKITSNISGSALKCPNLTLKPGVTLELLSRNSQANMFALDCADVLTVDHATLNADVTTSPLAVAVRSMDLIGCWLQKPRGGFVSAYVGGICFGDGLAAQVVRIVTDGFGVEEDGIEATESRVQKIVEDGQLIIIRDGQRYNVNGQRMR